MSDVRRQRGVRAGPRAEVGDVIGLVGAGRPPRRLRRSSIASAASRSAVPVAWVRVASTMRPLRFSVIRWPIWQSLASLPAPLRNKRASGSVVEECVSLRRFSPWKLRSALRLPPRAAAPAVLRYEALHAAQASISVPSTEKCSLESSLRTCGRFSMATKNLLAISPSSSRSRFLQNTVASHTASSERARRTSGTADYSRAAPSTAVPSAPCRTPAAAAHAAAAPAGSTAARRANTSDRTTATTLPGGVNKFTDRSQRMIRWNAALQSHVAEKTFRPLIFAAHHVPHRKESTTCGTESRRLAKRLFQQPASLTESESRGDCH